MAEEEEEGGDYVADDSESIPYTIGKIAGFTMIVLTIAYIVYHYRNKIKLAIQKLKQTKNNNK